VVVVVMAVMVNVVVVEKNPIIFKHCGYPPVQRLIRSPRPSIDEGKMAGDRLIRL
jgi:hypothetical protein